MLVEVDAGYFFAETAEYIRKTYPIDQAEVDSIVKQKKEIEAGSKYFSATTSLFFDAAVMAEDAGIDSHLLPTLAALQTLEKELPDDKRQLTPKKYLEFLATAELTSAHKNANGLKKFESVELHAARALKLLEFLKDFG